MKNVAIIILIVCAGVGIYFAVERSPSVTYVTPVPSAPTTPTPTPTPEPEKPITENGYTTITLTTDKPGKELSEAIGFKNIPAVLALNRIDDKHLWTGLTITIPTSFEDWQPVFMPVTIATATSIPKLVIIAQRTQSFGIYEHGTLVRSGPISSGKETTQTPNALHFANWKGKDVVSTFSDEWNLKWNVNVDNFGGIGIHLYALPGYPASHSCVRLLEADAMWLYDWVDQWVLANDGVTKIASGTPIIIFGDYNFKRSAPWKRLPKDPNAETISQDDIEAIVSEYLPSIQKENARRADVLAKP